MQSSARVTTIADTIQLPLLEDDNTVYQRFIRFHTQYPKVYELFKAFAIQLIGKGHKQLGGRMIIERIRWEMATGSQDEQGFKINNDFIAHYTRLFQQEHKEYVDYFETRNIKRL